MTIRSMGLAPLLAAGMAALAMTLAPIADASPTTSGNGAGSDSSSAGRRVRMGEDRVPGDVEIKYSHSIHFPPLYPDFGSKGIYHHGHHHH